MFPDINSEEGNEVGSEVGDHVLVGSLEVLDGTGGLVVGEPAPAGALTRRSALQKAACNTWLHRLLTLTLTPTLTPTLTLT